MDPVNARTQGALRNNAVVELNHLVLSHNGISEDGASSIAVLLSATQDLATLDLSHNPLTDEGIRFIADVSGDGISISAMMSFYTFQLLPFLSKYVVSLDSALPIWSLILIITKL